MLILPYYFLFFLTASLRNDVSIPAPSLGEDLVDTQAVPSIEGLFHQLSAQPMSLPLRREITLNEEGGHIQGIQLLQDASGYSAFFSGSSKEVAYLARAKLEKDAKIHAIDTLMLSPYRHAGGFQMYGHFLAVGVEDNNLRTMSKVVIYDVSSGKNWGNPSYVLDRNGPYERSTAGAVGITRYKDEIILIVADWDARNLDFYSCAAFSFERRERHFTQIGSIEMASVDKYSWSDSSWHSYQNINLIADATGLYAIALARDSYGNHVADLFTITMGDTALENKVISPVKTASQGAYGTKSAIHEFNPRKISLEKISSRFFQCEEGADFKAGAGIFQSEAGLILAAAPYHMNNASSVNLFASPPDLVLSKTPSVEK